MVPPGRTERQFGEAEAGAVFGRALPIGGGGCEPRYGAGSRWPASTTVRAVEPTPWETTT
jgi:hypothetical protein